MSNESQSSTNHVSASGPQPVTVNVTVKNRNPNNIFLILLILVGIGAGYWFWSSSQPSPGDTVERFFTAFNDKDMDAMIGCLDPKYEKVYGAMSSIFGSLVGISGKDMMAFFPFMYELALEDPANADMEDLQIRAKVLSTRIDGDRAVVVVSAEVTDRRTGKVKDAGEDAVNLRKFPDVGWRIVDLD